MLSETICYNCGNDQADTAEHVIAKTLIPEPRPSNLITVPACRAGNESFSKDEEYVRDRLSTVTAGPGFEIPEVWDVTFRSLQRSQAAGKKLVFFEDVFELPIAFQTKDGPSNMGVGLEKRRVNRVVDKIVKGFYFHHFKKPLGDVKFDTDMLSSINPSGNRKALLTVMESVYKSPTWARNFGSETHAICSLAEDDERAGLWSFKLFGQHIAVSLVAPKGFFEKQKTE